MLQQHLFWTAWSELMGKNIFVNPVNNKLWMEEDKLDKAFEEFAIYFSPYIKTRLDLYFEQRLLVLPESPTVLGVDQEDEEDQE